MNKILLISLMFFLVFLSSCSKNNEPIYYFDGTKISLSDDIFVNSKLKEFSSLSQLDIKKNKCESFVVFIYRKQCEASYALENVLNEFIIKRSIPIYSLEYTFIEGDSWIKNYIEKTPTVLIINNNNVIAQLNPLINEHKEYFEDVGSFENWFYTYIIR